MRASIEAARMQVLRAMMLSLPTLLASLQDCAECKWLRLSLTCLSLSMLIPAHCPGWSWTTWRRSCAGRWNTKRRSGSRARCSWSPSRRRVGPPTALLIIYRCFKARPDSGALTGLRTCHLGPCRFTMQPLQSIRADNLDRVRKPCLGQWAGWLCGCRLPPDPWLDRPWRASSKSASTVAQATPLCRSCA